jgi:hypothetical protein
MKRHSTSIGVALLIAAAVVTGCREDLASQANRTVSMIVPAGTNLVATLETRLATDTNHDGDAFLARTIEPVIVDGRTVVPSGTRIHGVLRGVQASGRIKGRAQMTLAFEQIEDSTGQLQSISARSVTLQAKSKTRGDVEKIAGGGVLGAIIGGIAGGGKGAAIGAGAGAGAGTILMLATKGDDVELNAGQRLNVYTTSPTSIVLVAME